MTKKRNQELLKLNGILKFKIMLTRAQDTEELIVVLLVVVELKKKI